MTIKNFAMQPFTSSNYLANERVIQYISKSEERVEEEGTPLGEGGCTMWMEEVAKC